jgi:cysteine desulfurase
MTPYFAEIYGNPVSGHSYGRKAEFALETAREAIAHILNCKPSEIVFTSGGSESDNLALRGSAWAAQRNRNSFRLVTTPVEHDAILKTGEQLADVMDFERVLLPVDRYGIANVDAFRQACGDETTLASFVYANNEIGTLQPITRLAHLHETQKVEFHTDAVQAAGQVSLDVQTLGVDMMSISAHKFYGPKGVGALYVREGIELIPNQSGGSHEEGRRAGTHNIPLIVGMAKALNLAYEEFDMHVPHYQRLRDQLIDGVLSRIPDVELTGHPANRLPTHASFVFAGLDSATLIMHLDMHGIAASAGSACKTGNPEPSGVLLAMGYSPKEAMSGLRLTVGRQTTVDDIAYTVETLVDVVEKLRTLNREMAL